ncbi:aminotransferase class III-fold pyridoxal phosphate-dependent enzyme [Streptomyces sp. NPDC046909]|uniref:aminotransferase class III-fold pyridoxal phosphate-dependent enzyme n=1 Tax=Streptomyces sp. NPDC046909 TaxID=3155617 RepID=UPI0033FEA6D8
MAESSYGECASEGSPRRQAARESSARTYAHALPIVPVRARGLTIEGADGRRYLDCVSGAGTLALGHNHPVVLEAIRKALESGAPLHALDLPTPVQDAFTTELLRTLPPGLADHARVRLCGPGGADAVAAAFRLVRAATGRTGMLAFTGAGHGGTAEVSRPPEEAADARMTRLPYPQDYRCPFGIGGPHGAELAARWTESLLDDPLSGIPDPAGLIVEPVQSEGGVIPAPDAWMRRVRQITAARSIPLIADEIHTGVGRTGAFWAVQHSGITPDVMILSKAIGGSLPLAVIVHRADLDPGKPDPHADPVRGNQLAMAAGTATLAYVHENALAERASVLGARMLRQLRGVAGRFACVGDVRGRGLMLGVELVDPGVGSGGGVGGGGGCGGGGCGGGGVAGAGCAGAGCVGAEEEAGAGSAGVDGARRGCGEGAACGPRPAAPELAAAVQRECLRRGLIVELGGRHDSVVRLLPPLTITDEQAEAVLDRLSEALEAVALGRTSSGEANRPPDTHHPIHVRHRRSDRVARTG